MTRDDDYIRELLFRMEADPGYEFISGNSMGSGDTEEKEFYHLLLLVDETLVAWVSKQAYSFRLTNKGHDFIHLIRSDTAWNKVKSAATSAGGVTLKMLGEIAVQLAKKKLAEKTGIEL